MDAKKLVVFSTVDPKKDTEKSSMALAIALTALASDCDVDMFYTLDGVYACQKDYLNGLDSGAFPPLRELMEAFVENGGKLYVCQPSLHLRKIETGALIDGLTVVSAPVFINAVLNGSIVCL